MEFAGPKRLRELLDAVLTVASGLDLAAILERIIQSAVEVSDATYGALGVLDESGTRLSQFITVGIDDLTHAAIGDLPEGHGILGLLIVDAEPLRLPDLTKHPDSYGFPPNHPPMRSFLGVPIRLRDQVFGNLYLTDKHSADEFSAIDEELMIVLAAAASVAIENARLHNRLHAMAVVEDRARIARDLHDTVIQRLFATGMSLQSTIKMIGSNTDVAIGRIEEAVDDLDLTVKHIRTAIFGLEDASVASGGLRNQVMGLVKETAEQLGFEPRVVMDGPLDTGVADRVGGELLSTLREALSNVVQHAGATHVSVEVTVADDLCLRVIDDGVGPPGEDVPRGNGLRNMTERAHLLSGSLTLRAGEPSGTVLEWRVART